MNNEYFEKASEAAKQVQKPIQEMAELTVKALQSFEYIKPEEMANLKKPEELIEKQIELAICNGHKALDYMQKGFQLMEKSLTSMLQATKVKKGAAKN